MPKRIIVSPTKSFLVSAFKNASGRYVSIRQMYRTKAEGEARDKTAWKHGKQGVSLPEEQALEILKAAKLQLDNIDEAQDIKKEED